MEIFKVSYSNLEIGYYVARDEAVVKAAEVDGVFTEVQLNGAYTESDSLRCDNVDGELKLFNESDREICNVDVKTEWFDDRLEEFFAPVCGYELRDIEIHGKSIDSLRLSDELKREIEHQAQNILDALNEDF